MMQCDSNGNVMKIHALPIHLTEARAFVENFHRHNSAPAGGKFAIGASDGNRLIGVAIVSRPVSRILDNGHTAEVIRCCVLPDALKNTCSFLYARCWIAAKAMGYHKLITYTLQSESGASLRGAGWQVIAELKPSDPKNWQSRPGREWHPVVGQAKLRWEA
tara:strand:- start:23 stop:505 length:483 start_codon:yes stop_codon:yes gene_type:complete